MSNDKQTVPSTTDLDSRDLKVTSKGGYCFVRPSRSKRQATAPAKAPAPLPAAIADFFADMDARAPTSELPADYVAPLLQAEAQPVVPDRRTKMFTGPLVPREPAMAAPPTCDCERMARATRERILKVSIEGEPKPFRYCPFEDSPVRLLAEQVPQAEPADDAAHCCRTLAQAVAHGHVAMPEPFRTGHLPAFKRPGQLSCPFSTCPWCAKSMIDLAVSRYKRHYSKT